MNQNLTSTVTSQGTLGMVTLSAAILSAKFGGIIAPTARLVVPWGWNPAIFGMFDALALLPAEVRAFVMLTGVYPDARGLLRVEYDIPEAFVSNGARQAIGDIVQRAVDLAAWTCVDDGLPGWWSAGGGKTGPRVLCAECQGLGKGSKIHVA